MRDKMHLVADFETGQHVDFEKHGFGYGLYSPEGAFVEEVFGFDSMEAAAEAADRALKERGWLNPYKDLEGFK